EEWHRILERFFEILTEGVHRFEGTVNQYTGDGIMALFGAPIAHEDHARRACYAALHLQEGLRGYANELRLRRGLNFSARLGLNSGEVIVGSIGDDLRMDYTAQGQTVGLAARMEQIAEPGKVYLTANTAALVDGYFALTDLGEMEIKGVHGALHVHELQGTGVMRTRLDVSRSRGFSRFVGRGDEMQLLEAALARARDGNAQIVGIVGDAGLGKSRLCFEFLERCRARGLMTYETTGVSHGKAIPFLPILRLFRAFFGITEHDSDATARERIAGRLLLLDERLRESLPLLFDFMGVPDPENPAPRIDAEVRQRQLFDIVRRVTQARSQRETTVMLLEDLHWFDGGSAAFLEPLIDASIGTRAVVVLNFRPEYQAPWMGKSFYQQLPLAPLGADAIRELLGALLGNDPSTKGLAEVIHAKTAGNPFFTEEIVQNLIETKKLQGGKGAYKLVTPVDKLEVPATVHALLAARIDRLTEREKDVLQTAAVIGREFDEPTLAAVVEQEAPQLREALQKLKDTEFVYEQSLYPVAEYAFKHPLTQEVALASQLSEKRRTLHAAVARVIEAAHGGDETKLDEQAALLAHHWGEAGEAFAAAQWHARAAAFMEKDDLDESSRHWRKVRELLRSVADETGAAALGVDACFHGLATGARLELTDDLAQETLREGLDWAARTNDALQEGRMHQTFSVYEMQRTRVDSAISHAAAWARVAGASPDAERRACSLWPSLQPLLFRGDLTAAKKNAAAQHDWTRDHFEWG
ncbi:MAG: AAA family ATPase, partial [Proteobacteria bacterium]|nr:AAA family ATPase [Pseudomonadota bacterium]